MRLVCEILGKKKSIGKIVQVVLKMNIKEQVEGDVLQEVNLGDGLGFLLLFLSISLGLEVVCFVFQFF